MEIKQFVNTVFASNTYTISDEDSECIWLIDVGDIEGVLESFPKNTNIIGAFITHSHFDHIYGINKLINTFPNCIVFTSEDGKKGLFSEKLNLSFYHEDPIIFMGSKIQILREYDRIELFENCFLEILETPGHNKGCISYILENYLFTGDSFIPNVKIVTKLKGGDREANKTSLQKLMDHISENTIICPGHGEMTKIRK